MPFMAALPAITAGASLIGRLFGGAGKGSADQRLTENDQRLRATQMQNADALARASLANSAATTRAAMQNSDTYNRAGLDLERRRFQQTEPNLQARQAAIGSLLSRIQPLALSGLSARTQGRMPRMNSIIDALGPEARQAGSLLASRGLSGLQAGPTQFADLPPVSLPPEVQLPPALVASLKGSGLLEKILGGGGLIGSIVGGLGDLGNFGGGSRAYTDSDWQGPLPGGG